MCQLGARQTIPPPPPDISDHWHDIHHIPRTIIEWLEEHWPYVLMWSSRSESIVPHDEEYDDNTRMRYLVWFNHEGMRMIWWRGSTAGGLYDGLPNQGGV